MRYYTPPFYKDIIAYLYAFSGYVFKRRIDVLQQISCYGKNWFAKTRNDYTFKTNKVFSLYSIVS